MMWREWSMMDVIIRANDLEREFCMIEMELLSMMDCGRMINLIQSNPMAEQLTIIQK